MDQQTADLARYLIRQRESANRFATEHPELPQLRARYEGEAHAYQMALAWIAGTEGAYNVAGLEVALERAETPA